MEHLLCLITLSLVLPALILTKDVSKPSQTTIKIVNSSTSTPSPTTSTTQKLPETTTPSIPMYITPTETINGTRSTTHDQSLTEHSSPNPLPTSTKEHETSSTVNTEFSKQAIESSSASGTFESTTTTITASYLKTTTITTPPILLTVSPSKTVGSAPSTATIIRLPTLTVPFETSITTHDLQPSTTLPKTPTTDFDIASSSSIVADSWNSSAVTIDATSITESPTTFTTSDLTTTTRLKTPTTDFYVAPTTSSIVVKGSKSSASTLDASTELMAPSESSFFSPRTSSQTLNPQLPSTSKTLTDSSSLKKPKSTSIKPTPGHSVIPTSSDSVASKTYNITVQAIYEGNCAVLKSNKTLKGLFFEKLEMEFEKIFSPSDVFVDRSFKCGSVIFNYTVLAGSTEKSFMKKFDNVKALNITVGGLKFSAKSSKIVKGFPTTNPPKKPNDEKLTVLYATIFSVVGFVFIVIIVVIYIGCRKNVTTKHKRAYELGRFSNTTTTAGVGMYGEESRTSKTPSESRSDNKEDSLPTTWNNIPSNKDEASGGKTKIKDQNQNGIENKGLENDEDAK